MSNQLCRQEELQRLRERYARRNKQGKSRLLDEFREHYGYTRKHAIKLLGDSLARPTGQPRSGPEPRYEPIELPRNTPVGFILSFFAVVTGFALIWHIWWVAALGLLAAFVVILAFGWSDDREQELSAADVTRIEQARLAPRQAA